MRLSIITINLNNKDGLEKTILSVLAQTYQEIEYIIIDGDSSDGSKTILEKYSSQLSYWVSEKDSGIYNAMNKGIRLSHGEYLLFLNSGDYLVDYEVISKVIPQLDGSQIIQGNIITFEGESPKRDRGYGKSELDLYEIFQGHFLHQASFIRRNAFEQYGLYDESFQIAGDTAFFASSLAFHNASFKYIDCDISVFDTSGISSKNSTTNHQLQEEEYQLYKSKSFPPKVLNYIESNNKKIQFYNDIYQYKLLSLLARILHRIALMKIKNHNDSLV